MSKPASRPKPKPVPTRVPAYASNESPKKHATVSGRWLASALAIVVVGAFLCVWGVLCLTFWQGSWQLLYHPTAPLTKTPASAGIAFENVRFDVGQDGLPQLSGWWIPGSPGNGYTAIYLHGATGNLSDTIGSLTRLHAAGLNVLAFDYRGYGRSKFVRPSEKRLRQDAEAAIGYLRDTRHIPEGSLILAGSGLGANLALQVGAEHREAAGVILDEPIAAPADAIFRDPRAGLVPARLLVSERWNSSAAATNLSIPSLWFLRAPEHSGQATDQMAAVISQVKSRKMLVWISQPEGAETKYVDALSRWLGDLSHRGEPR